MRTDFDYTYTCSNAEISIDYGLILGNEHAIFIKAGLDGSMYGYENKYLDIADQLNSLYGYSVIVASNPSGSKNSLKEGVSVLKKYSDSQGLALSDISYFGFSNGAYLGFTEGYQCDFKDFLLINSPLMINYHKIKAGLAAINGHRTLIVYSEKDPSFKYAQMLSVCLAENMKIEIVPGADHQFTGMTEQFKLLPIEFFNPQRSN